jgi:peptide/nickel transport system permease protein
MNLSILRLIAGRLATGVLSLLAVSVVVFTITALLPGDAAQERLGQDATPEALAALRQQMGLTQSGPERYWQWLSGMVRGNPGQSTVSGAAVGELIASRLPASLLLAGITTAVSVPLALLLGILCALWRGSWFDRAASMTAVAVVSVPEFLVATLAVLIFAVQLRWLPALSSSIDTSSLGQMLKSFAMPVLSLACVIVAQMMRMTRAAVIDQLGAAYIEMVKLKGASPARMVLAHALPNAVGPIANAVALSLSYLLGGVIIIEVIFNYPGIAKLMVDAVAQRDMPLVQACAMIFCAAYLILVMLADVCGIVANPRLRHQ